MKSNSTKEVSGPFADYMNSNLPILKSDIQRYAISYLAENEDAAMEELVNEASEDLGMNEDSLEIRLYHSDLPRLEDEGLINYESSEGYIEISEDGREVTEWMKEFGLM